MFVRVSQYDYNLDLIGDALYHLAEPIPGAIAQALGEVARTRGMAILANIAKADPRRAGICRTLLLSWIGKVISSRGSFEMELPRDLTAPFPEILSGLAAASAQLLFIRSAVPVGYEYLLNTDTAPAQENQLWTGRSTGWVMSMI